MVWRHYFAELQSSGDLQRDVSSFLAQVGRGDTLAHCRAVATQARILAERFAVDVDRAYLAALAHDLAAVVPHEEAVAVATSLGLDPDPVERTVPILLHGPIAAAVLATRLSVQDEEILDAVRYHTTSRPDAGLLEQLVFVADKIALDPNSPVSDFVAAVRCAARESLVLAAFTYIDWAVVHGPELGWILHPNLLAAHEEMLLAGYGDA